MGIQRMISNLSWGLVLLTFAAVSARADLIGQSVEIDYLYPTQADIYQVLGTGTVTGPGYTVNSFGQHDYTVTGSQITLLNVAGEEVTFLSAIFNGYGLTETGGSPATITGVTVDSATDVSGFDSSRVSFDSTDVFLNMQSLSTEAGQEVVLDLQFGSSSVPEPGTLGFLGLGLAAMGIVRRFQHK